MRKRPVPSAVWGVALCATMGLWGCSKGSGDDNTPTRQQAESCPAVVPIGPDKIPHPENPTDCYGVVMTCNYCEYNEAGRFVEAGWEACGVCMDIETD